MIKIISFDTKKYYFKDLFVGCLGELETVHERYEIEEVEEVTAGGIVEPEYNTQYGLIEKLFEEVVHKKQFQSIWKNFCIDIIKDFFDNEDILIQKLPSIKIFPSGHNWKFVENTKIINDRDVNFHYEYEYPFHHPKFELNFIVSLIDMDKNNGIFVDKKYYNPKYGQILIFEQLEHGGYVKNLSKDTRVSIDFKALKYINYDKTLLSDSIMVKKRGQWTPQTEIFNLDYYYRKL